MNYLERIRSMGRDANPFFCLMGIEVEQAAGGQGVISMKVRPDMLNGEGWLQGGIFTALADEAMVLGIYSLTAPGEQVATISETTTFLGGARDGTLLATGKVVRKGKRVVFAEAEVRDGAAGGRLLSRSSAAFALRSGHPP
ncbi:MAG: Thioesterase superfamily protein [Methanoregulaceae archaeon PtaB.Bin056]|jgi:uncharacterized protein (TIGR00369 family)|nr:MAG: Thioesterase superfamily protein [Methanoregulaceae archaeon PtaB.Bin056]